MRTLFIFSMLAMGLSFCTPLEAKSLSNFLPLPDHSLYMEWSKNRRITVKLEEVQEIVNVHVGHDWSHYLSIDDQIIRVNDSLDITLEKRSPLVVEAHAYEHDKHHPDLGMERVTYPYSDVIAKDHNRFAIEVTVVEDGGQYAGNIAKWKFIFSISL